MSDSRISILLGAGFSKAVFPEFPTMRELTKKVFEDEEVSLLIRALDRQLPLFEGKALDEVNIEEWFQILEESGAYFKDPKIYDRRKLVVQIALQVISKTIQDISRNLCFTEEQLDYFEKLFNSRVNIITTNYDLILEKALAELLVQKRIQVSTPYDLNVGSIEMAYTRKSATYLGAGSTDRNKYSRIFKLHGSCDWFTPEIDSSEQIYADTSLVPNFLREELHNVSREVCESMSPVMAGPTSLKSHLINSKALKPIWIATYSALRNTSKLLIFGSSLHSSDAALNSLIMEGLPTSVGAKVFDVNPKNVLDRIDKLTISTSNDAANPENVTPKKFIDLVALFQEASVK